MSTSIVENTLLVWWNQGFSICFSSWEVSLTFRISGLICSTEQYRPLIFAMLLKTDGSFYWESLGKVGNCKDYQWRWQFTKIRLHKVLPPCTGATWISMRNLKCHLSWLYLVWAGLHNCVLASDSMRNKQHCFYPISIIEISTLFVFFLVCVVYIMNELYDISWL